MKTAFNVKIILEKNVINKGFSLERVSIERVSTLRTNGDRNLFFKFWKLLDSVMYRLLRRRLFVSYLVSKVFKKALKNEKIAKNKHSNIVIGVDAVGALAGIAAFGKCHLLSLEIYEGDLITKLLNLKKHQLQSLMIQSQDREVLLFPSFDRPKFYIQNAPTFKNIVKGNYTDKKIISLGSFIPKMGSEIICEFARANQDYSIVVKGLIPTDVDHRVPNNIILERKYIEQHLLPEYLKHFEIGFCIYDFSKISLDEYNHFNHLPSGKMFNYFNALVPCIGNKCAGLNPIESFGAGILLENTSPENIICAISKIRQNYAEYVKGCKKAAKHFDFNRNSQEYLDFLTLQ